MISPLSTGLNGINQGMDNLKKDAHEIASSVAKGNENMNDLAASMVDLNVDKRQVEASVKVVQAVDEALGTLINLTA